MLTAIFNLQLHQYNWMDGPDVNESGICVKSTTMMTLARSPAYELKGSCPFNLSQDLTTTTSVSCFVYETDRTAVKFHSLLGLGLSAGTLSPAKVVCC